MILADFAVYFAVVFVLAFSIIWGMLPHDVSRRARRRVRIWFFERLWLAGGAIERLGYRLRDWADPRMR